MSTEVTIVTGPPCGGKSTYVREHAKPGDIVIDLDRIAAALATENADAHDFPLYLRRVALDVRDVAIGRALALVRAGECSLWVIQTTLGTFADVAAEFVTVDPGIEECMERARRDHRPSWTADIIRKWYANA